MRPNLALLLSLFSLAAAATLLAQQADNCFLTDYVPRNASLPPAQTSIKTTATPAVTVTISTHDTLGTVSPYIFGNALAAWVGNDILNPVLIGHIRKLSPTFIRYPGGSGGDIFFWNGDPGDLPSTIPDGTNNGAPIALSPQYGLHRWTTTLDTY